MSKQDVIDQVLTQVLTQCPDVGPDELFDMVWDELDEIGITLNRDERIALSNAIDPSRCATPLVTTMTLTFDGYIVPEGTKFYNMQPVDTGWAVTYLGIPLTVTHDQGAITA